MPSLPLLSDAEEAKVLQLKKPKKVDSMAVDLPFAASADDEKKSEKKKKKKKHKEIESDELEIDDIEKKVMKKKRKASDEETSDTSFDAGVPVVEDSKKKKKKLKVVEGDDGEVSGSGEEDSGKNPNAVSNFRISEPLREKLKSKGIGSLFPIQAMTFDVILDGSDLVGRARTGQVKTISASFFSWLYCFQ